MPFVCSIVVAQLLIFSKKFQFLVVVMVHTRFSSLTPQSQKSTPPSSRSSTLSSAAAVKVDVPYSSKSRGKKRSMSKNVDDKKSKKRKKGKSVDEAPVETVQKVFVDDVFRQQRNANLQEGMKFNAYLIIKETTMFIVVRPKKADLRPLSPYYYL